MNNETNGDLRQLREVGERFIVRKIISSLQASTDLIDGIGNDAAFLDLPRGSDELLVINTDRSGLNIAYQLGLAGAECVGDLGVSHAISDIVAAGGQPRAVSIALLLPPDSQVTFVLDVMKGAEEAAQRYGAVIVGGDTKQNPKFAMVVTAIGTVQRKNRLVRSNAKKGDALIVTGHLGSMLLGTIAYRNNLDVSGDIQAVLHNALVCQRPPYEIGRALADAGVAHASMDISDGLSGSVFAICEASGVGAVIDEEKIPLAPILKEFAASLGIRPAQLALAGGDWQFLYAIPADNLSEVKALARRLGAQVSPIGTVIGDTNLIVARTVEGEYRQLNRIEHDSFYDGSKGVSYFKSLESSRECFGCLVDDRIVDTALGS